jgi:prepilin-type processing-associated H-X9-DG protein
LTGQEFHYTQVVGNHQGNPFWGLAVGQAAYAGSEGTAPEGPLIDYRQTAAKPFTSLPSSHHPGGVIVSFCDGHQQFLSDDTQYRVYQHLMTPDSSAAGVPGVLKDEDF